jgi:hypothetical protein
MVHRQIHHRSNGKSAFRCQSHIQPRNLLK